MYVYFILTLKTDILAFDVNSVNVCNELTIDPEFILDLYDHSVEVTIWELVHEDENPPVLSNQQFDKLMQKEGFFESDTAVEPDPVQVERFASTAASRAAMILANAPVESIDERKQHIPTIISKVPRPKSAGLENFDQWIRFKAKALEREKVAASGPKIIREDTSLPVSRPATKARVKMVSGFDDVLDSSNGMSSESRKKMPKSLIKLPKAPSQMQTTSLESHSNALRILAQITAQSLAGSVNEDAKVAFAAMRHSNNYEPKQQQPFKPAQEEVKQVNQVDFQQPEASVEPERTYAIQRPRGEHARQSIAQKHQAAKIQEEESIQRNFSAHHRIVNEQSTAPRPANDSAMKETVQVQSLNQDRSKNIVEPQSIERAEAFSTHTTPPARRQSFVEQGPRSCQESAKVRATLAEPIRPVIAEKPEEIVTPQQQPVQSYKQEITVRNADNQSVLLADSAIAQDVPKKKIHRRVKSENSDANNSKSRETSVLKSKSNKKQYASETETPAFKIVPKKKPVAVKKKAVSAPAPPRAFVTRTTHGAPSTPGKSGPLPHHYDLPDRHLFSDSQYGLHKSRSTLSLIKQHPGLYHKENPEPHHSEHFYTSLHRKSSAPNSDVEGGKGKKKAIKDKNLLSTAARSAKLAQTKAAVRATATKNAKLASEESERAKKAAVLKPKKIPIKKKMVVAVSEDSDSSGAFSDDGMPVVRKADPNAKARRRERTVSAKKVAAPKQPQTPKPAKEPKPVKELVVKVKKERPAKIVAVKPMPAKKQQPERSVNVKSFPMKNASPASSPLTKPVALRNKVRKQDVKLGAAINDLLREDNYEVEAFTHEIPDSPVYKDALKNALRPEPFLNKPRSAEEVQKLSIRSSLSSPKNSVVAREREDCQEEYFDQVLYEKPNVGSGQHNGLKSRTVMKQKAVSKNSITMDDLDDEFDAVFSRQPVAAKSNVSRHATKVLENEWELERQRLLETLEESRPSFSNIVKKKRHEYVPVVAGKIILDVTAIFLGELVVHEAYIFYSCNHVDLMAKLMEFKDSMCMSVLMHPCCQRSKYDCKIPIL
jgi:hypothetical protein